MGQPAGIGVLMGILETTLLLERRRMGQMQAIARVHEQDQVLYPNRFPTELATILEQ